MSTETIKTGWLKDKEGNKFAPKTLTSQVQTSNGILLEDKLQEDLNTAKTEILDSVIENIDMSAYETKEDAQNKLAEAKVYVDEQITNHKYSYNDLTDKPFYEETEIINEPLNITWDGNTEGLLCVEDKGNYITWCKVSDMILTDEQIKLITETSSNDNSTNISDIWEELGATNDIVCSYWAIYIRKAGTELFDSGLVFPETGIYFYKDNYEYTTSITTIEPIEYVKSTIYKIDEKFLPLHTWDNLKNKPFGEPILELGTIVGEFTGECVEDNNYDSSKIIYTVRNRNVPAFPGECQEKNANITVIYDGVEYKTTYWIDNFGGMLYGIGNKGLYFSHAEDTGEPFAWYYFGGSYAVSSKEPGEHTLAVRVGDHETVTKLDSKYLPTYNVYVKDYNSDGTPILNKSYATIKEWVDSGVNVVLFDGDTIYNIEYAYSSSGQFCFGHTKFSGIVIEHYCIYLMPDETTTTYLKTLVTLPAITNEDNGKILKVVNGQWALVTE